MDWLPSGADAAVALPGREGTAWAISEDRPLRLPEGPPCSPARPADPSDARWAMSGLSSRTQLSAASLLSSGSAPGGRARGGEGVQAVAGEVEGLQARGAHRARSAGSSAQAAAAKVEALQPREAWRSRRA